MTRARAKYKLVTLCLSVILFAVSLSLLIYLTVPTKTSYAKSAEVNSAETLQSAINIEQNTAILTADINLPKTLIINKTVTLDLNGYMLLYEGDSGSVIKIKAGGVLTLQNSDATTLHICQMGENMFLFDNEQATSQDTTYLQGGVIAGGKGELIGGSSIGGGIYVCENGVLKMTGGTVAGNTAEQGAGIYNKGTVEMSGGIIAGNYATEIGGGICNNNSLNISGSARIFKNTADVSGGGIYNAKECNFEAGDVSGNSTSGYGGGVFNAGTFSMKAGTISYNTAKNGGGVQAWSGTFNLAGGTITKNEIKIYLSDTDMSTENGGGVCVGGSEQSVTFNVSGAPVIENNIMIVCENEEAESTVKVSTDVYLLANNKINVVAPLTDGAKIYVVPNTQSSDQTITTGFNTYNATATPSTYFFTNDKSYYISVNNGEVVLLPTTI
jgi:hypothetical protein